jgi:acyl-coenzyme A synthetase/AMP-(fatty) acid ligase
LNAHVAAHLAPYKRPAHIRVVSAFPMTHSGKVLKRELVALFKD